MFLTPIPCLLRPVPGMSGRLLKPGHLQCSVACSCCVISTGPLVHMPMCTLGLLLVIVCNNCQIRNNFRYHYMQ